MLNNSQIQRLKGKIKPKKEARQEKEAHTKTNAKITEVLKREPKHLPETSQAALTKLAQLGRGMKTFDEGGIRQTKMRVPPRDELVPQREVPGRNAPDGNSQRNDRHHRSHQKPYHIGTEETAT